MPHPRNPSLQVPRYNQALQDVAAAGKAGGDLEVLDLNRALWLRVHDDLDKMGVLRKRAGLWRLYGFYRGSIMLACCGAHCRSPTSPVAHGPPGLQGRGAYNKLKSCQSIVQRNVANVVFLVYCKPQPIVSNT